MCKTFWVPEAPVQTLVLRRLCSPNVSRSSQGDPALHKVSYNGKRLHSGPCSIPVSQKHVTGKYSGLSFQLLSFKNGPAFLGWKYSWETGGSLVAVQPKEMNTFLHKSASGK